jgi:hypothetical protein
MAGDGVVRQRRVASLGGMRKRMGDSYTSNRITPKSDMSRYETVAESIYRWVGSSSASRKRTFCSNEHAGFVGENGENCTSSSFVTCKLLSRLYI